MPFNINDIRAQLTGGGARANLFEVVMPFPAISNPGSASSKMTFTCKSASLPESALGIVNVPYFGRTIKLAGNRTFAEWTTTIINDEDFVVYSAIQTWMNAINSHSGNIRETAGTSPNEYQSSADIVHYGKNGDEIKRITMVNMWPSTLAQVDLAWETNDALEEYTVTWQYDYWNSAGTTS